MLTAKQSRKARYRRNPTKRIEIQERDVQILWQTFKHRFLTSRHIAALVGGSEQVVLRRLNLLYHASYLDRPPEQIRPYKPGSTPMVYGLGNRGAEILKERFSVKPGKVDWTSKNRDVKIIYLKHTLNVSNFMVCLELATRNIGNVKLIPQSEIIKNINQASNKKSSISAIAWKIRANREIDGNFRKINFSIIPDQLFGLYFPDDPPGRNKTYFALEADRSTMPVKRSNFYKTSYFKKMLGYWESYQQGVIKEIFGIKAIRVLTIAKTKERIKNIIKAGKRVDKRKKGSKMFLFALSDEFNITSPEHVFDRVWQNGRDQELISIIE